MTALSLPVQNIDSPGVDINAYTNKIASIPILTVEQEQALAKKCFHEEDVEAARQLVMAHLRFVVYIARSYSGYGLPQGDIIQEGNVGLMKAVKRFNPDVGVRMMSFAVHWIKAEIHDYLLRNWRIVKVATTKAQRKLFFNLRKSKKRLQWLTDDEAMVIAENLGVALKDVKEMEGRMLIGDTPFDGISSDSADDEDKMSPEHYLQDSNSNPALAYETSKKKQDDTNSLHESLKHLDPRSLDIIQSRWLSEDKKLTLHDLAAKYNISAERVRQIENRAMKKIRLSLAAA